MHQKPLMNNCYARQVFGTFLTWHSFQLVNQALNMTAASMVGRPTKKQTTQKHHINIMQENYHAKLHFPWQALLEISMKLRRMAVKLLETSYWGMI